MRQFHKGKGRARRLMWSAGVALMLACASAAAWCQGGGANPDDSPLRKFENGARPAQDPQPAPASPGSGDSGEHGDSDWLADLLNILFSGKDTQAPGSGGGSSGQGSSEDSPAQGPDIGDAWPDLQFHTFLDRPTSLTMHRLDPQAEAAVRRDDGDILIPYVRYDFAYNHVSSSISGVDNRLELGWGVIGILADEYYLTDSAYGVSLTMDRYLLQYRLSINRRGELDLGVGETDLLGANYTQLGTVSVAARFIAAEHLMVEFRPTWANTIQDYEGAVAYTRSGWSLKAGYRSMTSPGGTLQGPFVGFALHD